MINLITENQGVDSSNLSLGTKKTRSKGGFFAVLAYGWIKIEQVLCLATFRSKCLTRRVSHSFFTCQALSS